MKMPFAPSCSRTAEAYFTSSSVGPPRRILCLNGRQPQSYGRTTLPVLSVVSSRQRLFPRPPTHHIGSPPHRWSTFLHVVRPPSGFFSRTGGSPIQFAS